MPFANKEDMKKCKAAWYLKNKKRLLKEHKKWREENKDRVAELKKQYHERVKTRDAGKAIIVYNGINVLYNRKKVAGIIPDRNIRESANAYFKRNGISVENIPMDLYLTKCASIIYEELAKNARGVNK